MIKPYAESRISFIVLKADCFNKYGANSIGTPEKARDVLKELKKSIEGVGNPAKVEFLHREQKYHTTFNYVPYADSQLAGFKDRIDTLGTRKTFTEDDIEFLELGYLYVNCTAYFANCWYLFPEIKFSERFYQQFFKVKEKKLFEHYLYDNDSTNEFNLPIAATFPGKYEYIPPPPCHR